jgi:hypothetical protein
MSDEYQRRVTYKLLNLGRPEPLRRFQFTLRQLFWVVLAVAAVCSLGVSVDWSRLWSALWENVLVPIIVWLDPWFPPDRWQ